MLQVVVTLQFQSAEEATAALAKLCLKPITVDTRPPGGMGHGAEQPPKDTKPAGDAKPEATAEAGKVKRKAVSDLAIKLAVKNKAKAVEIMQGFGVKAVRELPDDKLAECHKKLTAALAEG